MGKEAFKQLVAGKAPSMMNHDVANEVIDCCASFDALQFSPAGSAKLVRNGRSATIQFGSTAIGGGDLDLVLCVDGELHSITVVGTDNGVIT